MHLLGYDLFADNLCVEVMFHLHTIYVLISRCTCRQYVYGGHVLLGQLCWAEMESKHSGQLQRYKSCVLRGTLTNHCPINRLSVHSSQSQIENREMKDVNTTVQGILVISVQSTYLKWSEESTYLKWSEHRVPGILADHETCLVTEHKTFSCAAVIRADH